MALKENINVFKKIIPREKLSAEDKKAVMDTIATAKLFIETIDIITTKQAQTNIEFFKHFSNDKKNGS